MPHPADRGNETPQPAGDSARHASGMLAGMRIRKKLIFLHTAFSLVLAAILWLALQPAVQQVVQRAEEHEARVALGLLLAAGVATDDRPSEHLASALGPDVRVRWGTASLLNVPPEHESAARASRSPVAFLDTDGHATAAAYLPPPANDRDGTFISVTVRQDSSRAAVTRLYVLMTVALLAVYALVAAALEIFVLPRHVYEPIRAILAADRAVAEGSREQELIGDASIPADELGEIMRSRNRSITALRRHEADLAVALQRIEEVATDLKRKNHLLETARQNLADADRLASLGIMSAGLAHELNTPLAVIKGLAEKLNAESGSGPGRRSISAIEAALLLRVVGRLERLSESLLDFARARPPASQDTALRPVVDEACTLVRLDRETTPATIVNNVPENVHAWCDPDRIMQVLVNLLRNAADALTGPAVRGRADGPAPEVAIDAEESIRDGRRWVSITVSDNGPGIDPEILPRLFQPFASTRLDSRGTGLGLATSEGIVKEHGGVMLARNRLNDQGRVAGAVFEIMLPADQA